MRRQVLAEDTRYDAEFLSVFWSSWIHGYTHKRSSTYRKSILGQFVIVKNIGNILDDGRFDGCSTNVVQHFVPFGTTNDLSLFSKCVERKKWRQHAQ